MDTDFYVVNKPTKKKGVASGCLNRLKEFHKLSSKLDECVDGCLLTFYQNVLDHFICPNGIRKPKKEKMIPSLFIQGECVCWDVVFEKITGVLKHKIIFVCVTPSSVCMRSFKEQIKRAEAENRVLLVFILQVESFTRSSIIDNVIEIMTESRCSKFLTFNTTVSYSMILDRMSRVNYTTLEVQLLELEPPINLLYSIYDQLLSHNVLKIQFSADVLMKAYLRFMHECYSVAELKKCFNMALTDYAFDENRNPTTTADYLSKWSQYFSLVNVLNNFEFTDTDLDKFYSFLKLHCKIQTDSNFINNYTSRRSHLWRNWKRSRWDDKIKLLVESLSEFPELESFTNDIKEIRRQLSEETTTNSSGASERNPSPDKRRDVADDNDSFMKKLNVGPQSPGRKRMTTAAEYYSQRSQDLQRPSNALFSSIQNLLHNLMERVLIKFPAEFIAKIPPEQMEYLQTSNMPKMDEIMNGRIEIDDSRFQIDVVTLYHVLVDESSELLTTELRQAFQKFQASFKSSSKLGDLDLETRFFHALAQMEYLGIIAMNEDNSCRLVYLPASMALNNEKDPSDEAPIEED